MANWYEYYELDRDPFAEGGIQGLFYPGGARQEIVEQLQHLARFSDSVLLVSGVPGAGKTAVARHFLSQCATDVQTSFVEAAILESPETLLRRVLAGFDVRPAGAPALMPDMQQLETCIETSKNYKRLVWIVVDDAQHLNQDAMALLPQLIRLAGGYARLILCAEPQWVALFKQGFAPELAAHVLDLPPLDRGESYAYIHYRLKTAGMEGEPPFSAGEFAALHRQSEGVPGRINALARKVLSDGAGVVQQPLSALPLWHFGVVAATLVALLLLYYWVSLDDSEDGPAGQPIAHPVVQTDTTTEIAASPTDDAVSPGGMIAESTVAAGIEEADAATVNTSPAAPEEMDARDEVVQPDPVPEPVSVAQPGSGAEPASKGVESATSVVKTASPPTTPAKDGLSEDEQFLMARPAANFTIQVMASDNAAQIDAFTRQESLALRGFRKLHQGSEWRVVVHGDFARRADAEAALAALPGNLLSGRPWVRTLGAVQSDIRKARGS